MTPGPVVITDAQGVGLLLAGWLLPLLWIVAARLARRRLRQPTVADSAAELARRDNRFGGMW